MTKKVFNLAGGKHSDQAYTALENRAYGSCVANAASFVVSAGSGMQLNIAAGDGLISIDAFSARRIQTNATENVTVNAASASFNRIDTVVAYIDTTVTPTTSVTDNTNDVLKFKCVAGTASDSPTPPSGATIQSSIGAGNPYMVLYNVTVPQNATNMSGATYSDQRNIMTIIQASQLAANSVTEAKIAAAAVKYDKLKGSDWPACALYQTSAQTLSSAGAPPYNTLAWHAAAYNIGSMWSAGNNTRITAPVTGYYLVTASVGNSSGTGRRGIAIWKNGADMGGEGSELTGLMGTIGGTSSVFMSRVVKLAAGDYIQITFYQDSGGNITSATNRTNVTCNLLSPA